MTAHATAHRLSPPVEPAANDAGACPWSPSDPPRPAFEFGVDGCAVAGDLCVAHSPFALVGTLGNASLKMRLNALHADDTAYDGDLWSDVIEYRTVRRRLLGGAQLVAPEQLRLGVLEGRLRAVGEQRQFHRFRCHHPALLQTSSTSVPVEIVDISAGGAKLLGAPPLSEGDDVELVIESEGVPTVAMPSRVIWVRAGATGVMFAGAPRWS